MPPTIKNDLIRKTVKKIKDITPKSRFMWAMASFLLGRSAYHQLGWFKSAWKENAVNAKGESIPWISYPAISFIESRLKKDMDVFEYGSGSSTVWWANKVGSIIAVEHHEGWYMHVKEQLKKYKRAKVVFKELGDNYPKTIADVDKKFDIVVVDGRMRVACAEASIKYLKKGGVIVWDNTDREKYFQGIKLLKKNGFKDLNFVGPVPIGNYLGQTTVFYKDKNVLGI